MDGYSKLRSPRLSTSVDPDAAEVFLCLCIADQIRVNQPQAAGSVAGILLTLMLVIPLSSPAMACVVILRQLVAKNMHEYKMKALLDLSKVFREAGKPFGDSVFAAGIGNKCTDAVAYRAAGIPPDFIFLIDKESHLQASVFLLLSIGSSVCFGCPVIRPTE